MSASWLTIPQAAERVGRTERSIRNWIANGDVKATLGRVREADLVRVEKQKRTNRAQGRPRKETS